jgi:hypothetical protein
MDIQILTRFFMWCSVLNIGLLMFSFLMLAFAGDFVYVCMPNGSLCHGRGLTR